MTDQATFSVNLAGRDVLFRQPIAGQLIILRRRLLRLQSQAAQTTSEDEKLELGSKLIVDTLDVVESLIVNPQDVEFLEESMLLGKVGHEEVMQVLAMEPDEPAKATKRTTKAASKAVANRGRTKR